MISATATQSTEANRKIKLKNAKFPIINKKIKRRNKKLSNN